MTREELIEFVTTLYQIAESDCRLVPEDEEPYAEIIAILKQEPRKGNSNDASYQHTINELNKVVQEQAEEIRALKESRKESKKMARIELLEQLKLCVAIAPEFEEMLCKDARKIVEFFDRAIKQEQEGE